MEEKTATSAHDITLLFLLRKIKKYSPTFAKFIYRTGRERADRHGGLPAPHSQPAGGEGDPLAASRAVASAGHGELGPEQAGGGRDAERPLLAQRELWDLVDGVRDGGKCAGEERDSGRTLSGVLRDHPELGEFEFGNKGDLGGAL